jgi:NADH:ubiquinone oxidoreductase subunit F (NADH-binding)
VDILETPRSWPRVALGRTGRYHPDESFARAQRAGAWKAWKQAVAGMDPEAVIAAVTRSGLRGRGGAGYPAGDKWRLCRDQPGRRHVVANGYEADPGAQLDRTLMERDPHAVVEGTALAEFSVGASDAIIAVKAGYTVAIDRLAAAGEAAEEAGLVGIDAMGAGFDLQIEVRAVQGAFVLGEETVLLRTLEGKRAQPDQRPPFPAERGLWGEPTVVNNVETLAAVPWIVANGGEAYARIGSRQSPGTTLVQVSGSVSKPGIVEVPLGTRLGEILETAAGGASNGRVKAVFFGGPSGGFLPADGLDTRLAFGPLEQAGAIMGSGSMVVLDESACIVELATLMERFMTDAACGKTIPCRIGTQRLTEIGERFVGGRPRPGDVQLLHDLAADVKDGALCGHEYTAPNPLLTGMRYFAEEFEDHIVRSTCPAGVCRPLRVAVEAVH